MEVTLRFNEDVVAEKQTQNSVIEWFWAKNINIAVNIVYSVLCLWVCIYVNRKLNTCSEYWVN